MLIIVRHGQSLWNAENRFTGWKDIDLSPTGIREANDVGKIVEKYNLNINHVFTSSLVRSINTAKVIKGYIKSPINKSIETELLNERDYGCFTGLNKNDIKNKIEHL